jgi:VWFA-related protein
VTIVRAAGRTGRRLILLSTIALLTAAATLRPAAQESQPVFRARSDLVVLHVNVFDRRSDAVPDLPQSAFLVVEDDRPQEIAFFSRGDVPVAVGLAIDNSSSMISRRAMVVAATTAFADSSHPEDELFTVIFNEHVRYGLPEGAPFTRSPLQLISSLTRFAAGGRTALYDAVIAGLEHLEASMHQKRVLVVLSDGGDNASRHTEDEMLAKVLASDALVYTISHASSGDIDADPGVMKRMAELSGGLSYSPRTERDVIGDFGEIAGNIRRGYSLGYVPPAADDRRYHRVKVIVRAPGRGALTAHVRDGYTSLGANTAP